MLDPILALAFAMHSNRGVYAVLLGSGVSGAAGIPTGWEIVIDLIKKLAALKGQACDPDPEAWFHATFGEPADYSLLLKKIARSQAERQQLLRGYFEPSDADADAGAKQPTPAHHALATLVKSGHVRVILTTNFDRLIERALEAGGISPTIISTPHAVDGALPLTHASCTVVKLHGDYLDARIKNTTEELRKYDRRINRLLDRVLDEFGLIVCGWSATWDEALRHSFERCKSRRFTTYWTSRGSLSDAAQRLATQRAAQVIRVSSADDFFRELLDKVLALSAFDHPHPVSAKVAVATMKRLLPDDRRRIELHDLVKEEAERVMDATSDARMPVSGSVPCTRDEVQRRMGQYEAATSVLQHLFITGCRWGTTDHESLWTSTLERLANRPSTGGIHPCIELRRYPALLLLYSGGIAALTDMKMGSLRALLLDSRLRSDRGDGPEGPAVEVLDARAIMDQDTGRKFLPGAQAGYTPLNDYLFEILREPLRSLLPSDEDYERMFDRFEYFSALVCADQTLTDGIWTGWIPIGRFGWRNRVHGGCEVFKRTEQEAVAAGSAWPPIKAGLFASIERFKKAAEAVAERVSRTRWL